MRAKALTVHWHLDSQPVYSAHFQPGNHTITRLATGGGDNNVRVWKLDLNCQKDSTCDSSYQVTYLSTLSRHTQAVNVVKFDPKGEILASAGDDGTILLWVLSDTVIKEFGNESSDLDKETWKLRHACRVSLSEVYDLAWSPDSQYILAGSMDNVARIYNASNGQCIRQLAEHQHYVQGVAWDPLNEFIATQSSDRSVHIYTLKTKNGQFSLSTPHKISRAEVPSIHLAGRRDSDSSVNQSGSAPETPRSMDPPPQRTHSRKSSFSNKGDSPSPSLPLPAVRSIGSPSLSAAQLATPSGSSFPSRTHSTNSHLYHNETFTSFFRRLTFTPEGSLLLTPSGILKHNTGDSAETTNTVYIYTRAGLNRAPAAYLPGFKKPSLAIRCSPVLYKLRDTHVISTKHFSIESSNDANEESIPIIKTDSAKNVDSAKTVDSGVETDESEIKRSNDSCPTTSTSQNSSLSNAPVFKLDYRIIYAVATQDAVVIYDTQQKTPLCIASNLHYATFTDLTWSPDGSSLLMTSTDGFCSIITFDPGELGEPYTGPLPKHEQISRDTVSSPAPPPFQFSSAHSSPALIHAELCPTVSASPESSSSIPLVPTISSVPPLATHGNSLSSPPSTPTMQAAPSPRKLDNATDNPEKKKRRIAPTLVESP